MKINLLGFLVVKSAAFLAGRFGGQAAASRVSQIAQATARKEIRAKMPAIFSAVDTAVVELEGEIGAIAPVLVDVARGRIVDEVATLGLSRDVQITVSAAIKAVEVPTVAEADKIIGAFATAIKAALTAI